MIATVESATCLGVRAYPVKVEVDVSNGLPQFNIVGLPDPTVKESRERIRAAIKNSGYEFPPDKVTVNLAPADMRKEGPAFDLPMALGILAATGIIPRGAFTPYLFLGELALDGSLRPVKGAIVIASTFKGDFSLVLPTENAGEASMEKNTTIYPAKNLGEVVRFLCGEKSLEPAPRSEFCGLSETQIHDSVNFSEVKGQFFAKRAIEIAVAGNHNLLMIGPPGSGKTMLARRIPTILPPLMLEEALSITKVYSVAGLTTGSRLITVRPFRSPHHSASSVALAGGGTWPKPGEISLAHGGVLFLDELPEFHRDALETLRSPLEDGEITVSRIKMQVTFPARILLTAAMNPCPCGYLGHPRKSCRCALGQIQKYQFKISGPILDRIDLHVEVPALPFQTLANDSAAESSEVIRERIVRCREKQAARLPDRPLKVNSLMRPRDIKEFARPDLEGRKLLEMAMKELHLSARAYYKILKISRTIADLAEADAISAEHIAEAIQYRTLDRQWRN